MPQALGAGCLEFQVTACGAGGAGRVEGPSRHHPRHAGRGRGTAHGAPRAQFSSEQHPRSRHPDAASVFEAQAGAQTSIWHLCGISVASQWHLCGISQRSSCHSVNIRMASLIVCLHGNLSMHAICKCCLQLVPGACSLLPPPSSSSTFSLPSFSSPPPLDLLSAKWKLKVCLSGSASSWNGSARWPSGMVG